jgi:putative inorganic carbon (hco3(-)) transporter
MTASARASFAGDDLATAASSRPEAQRHAEDTQGHRPKLPLDIFFATGCVLVTLRPMLDLSRSLRVGEFAVTDLAGGALVLLAGLGWAFGRTYKRRTRDSALRLLVAFVLFALLLGLINGGTRISTLSLVAAGLKLLVLPAAYCSFRHLEHRRPGRALKLLGLGAAPAFLLALYQLQSGTGLQVNEYVGESDVLRIAGPFAHPNALAVFAALIAVISFAVIMASSKSTQGTRVGRNWWALLGVLSLAALVPTYARIVWLALPLALVAMGVATRRLGVPFLAIAVAMAGALLVLGTSVETRLSGFSSISYRQVLWWYLLARLDVSDYPFGIGLGEVDAYVWETTGRIGISQVIQVHNDFLRVFIETGIVGAVIYFGAIGTAVLYAWRYLRGHRGDSNRQGTVLATATIGACVVVLVVSLTDNIFDLAVLQMLFWGLLGAFAPHIPRKSGSSTKP